MSRQHQELVRKYQTMIADNPTRLCIWGFEHAGVEVTRALTAALIQSSLTKISLECNKFGNKGAKVLARALPKSSLTTFSLSFNNIGYEGARALANVLPQSSLTTMKFAGNKIESEAVKILANKLPQSSLTKIDLQSNNIGVEGAKALAAALPASSLTALNLDFNCIGDAGVKAIADILSQSSLTTLSLRENSIGDEGAKALANTLAQSSIESINLWGNNIKDEGMKCLKEALFKPNYRIYITGIYKIDEVLALRRRFFLKAANKMLYSPSLKEKSSKKISDKKKISLFFRTKDAQIKCRNLIIQFFINKNGNYTNTISGLLPVPELLHHILSFVFPELSNRDIIQSWEIAEEKLITMTM